MAAALTQALRPGVLDSYRGNLDPEGICQAASAHLQAASEALSMALLTLAGEDDDRGDQLRRAQHAREFLAEALTSLSRARIYVPGIRTHTLSVLLATEPTPEAELLRLHSIATRLLWQNHAHLPARAQAKPMAPEEEAQLAIVIAGLARQGRIDRALRYKWSGTAALVAVCGAVMGLPIVGLLAGMMAVVLGLWRAAAHHRSMAPAT